MKTVTEDDKSRQGNGVNFVIGHIVAFLEDKLCEIKG